MKKEIFSLKLSQKIGRVLAWFFVLVLLLTGGLNVWAQTWQEPTQPPPDGQLPGPVWLQSSSPSPDNYQTGVFYLQSAPTYYNPPVIPPVATSYLQGMLVVGAKYDGTNWTFQPLTTSGQNIIYGAARTNAGSGTSLLKLEYNCSDGTNPGCSPGLIVNTSGNVGIGTANPQEKLDLKGATIIGDSNLSLTANKNLIYGVISNDSAKTSNLLKLQTYSANGFFDRFNVTKDGNVSVFGSWVTINPYGLRISPHGISHWEKFSAQTRPAILRRILWGICRPRRTNEGSSCSSYEYDQPSQSITTQQSPFAKIKGKLDLALKSFSILTAQAAISVQGESTVFCNDVVGWCSRDAPECSSLNSDGETGWLEETVEYDECCNVSKYVKKRVCYKKVEYTTVPTRLASQGFTWRPKINFYSEPCSYCYNEAGERVACKDLNNIVWPEQCILSSSATLFANAKDEELNITEIAGNLRVKESLHLEGASLTIYPRFSDLPRGLRITASGIQHWEKVKTPSGQNISVYKVLKGTCRPRRYGENEFCSFWHEQQQHVKSHKNFLSRLKSQFQNQLAKIIPGLQAAQIPPDDLIWNCIDILWCRKDAPTCESLNIDGETGWREVENSSKEDDCCGLSYISERTCVKTITGSDNEGFKGFTWQPKISFYSEPCGPLCNERSDEETSVTEIRGKLKVARSESMNLTGGDVEIQGRLTINSNPFTGGGISSSLVPTTTLSRDLGTSNYYWRNLYSQNGYFSSKVGIGTTNLIQNLDVNGRIHLNHGVIQRGGTAITATSDLGLYSQISGDWMRFVTNTAPIRFFTDGGIGTNARMTIESNGNVGIGTINLTANHRLDIVGGHLKVGSSDDRRGITLYDVLDGSAHCLRISNDALSIIAGVCP